MSCSILPSDFQNLVTDADAPVCDQLRKLGRLALTVSEAYSCIYNQDGSFTSDFVTKLCESGCAGGSTSGSTTDSLSGGTIYRASRFVGAGTYRAVMKGRVFSMDPTAWTYSTLSGDSYELLLALAFQPGTNTLWALSVNLEAADLVAGAATVNVPLRLGTVNQSTGAFTFVANLNFAGATEYNAGGWYPEDLAMVFQSNGTLLFMWNTQIWTMNVATAEATLLGGGNTVDSSGTTLQIVDGANRKSSGGPLATLSHQSGAPQFPGTLDPTPYAPFGNDVRISLSCYPGVGGPASKGPVLVGSAVYIAIPGTGDVYEIKNPAGVCFHPWTLKFLAPGSMVNTTCFINAAA